MTDPQTLPDGQPTADAEPEWSLFVRQLRLDAAGHDGTISQTRMREAITGRVHPQRIGYYYRRARRGGLITPSGYNVNRTHGSSAIGKPETAYRWTGGERVD